MRNETKGVLEVAAYPHSQYRSNNLKAILHNFIECSKLLMLLLVSRQRG